MTRPVFRFAPSPNGRLHLGHAYSALLNAEYAARSGGRLLLRIEDIDVTRCRSEFEAAIYEDLAWLGIVWETPVRRQSEHFDFYQERVVTLEQRNLIYRCFCTRKDIADEIARRGQDGARDPDGTPLYPGTCRNLASAQISERSARGTPFAWRLDLPRALAEVAAAGIKLSYPRFICADDRLQLGNEPGLAAPERWGDVIIVRKEIATSYHLSVVVDDALQGITHVVRGRDLEASTGVHRLLQALLGLQTPAYHHHDLIRDEAGGKLSKSLLSEPLQALRERGVTAAEIRGQLLAGV